MNEYEKYIEELHRSSGRGKWNSSLYNIISGINHAMPGLPTLDINKVGTGLVFFTKPCLNLSYDNLGSMRKLAFLADYNQPNFKYTTACAVKCMLMPYGIMNTPDSRMINAEYPGIRPVWDVRSEMVNDRSPFINLLTNTCVTLTGFPDISNDIYTSNPGIQNEVVSYIDTVAEDNQNYSVTATFKNIRGDVIKGLFAAWILYQRYVANGYMTPFPTFLVERELDYTTRPYIIGLDETRTKVTKIGAPISAFPTAYPSAEDFNYNINAPFVETESDVSIPFECVGFQPNDPILVYEFNSIVQKANINMNDTNRDNEMVALSGEYLDLKTYFNFKGYPRIEENYDFNWYVDRSLLAEKVNAIVQPETRSDFKGKLTNEPEFSALSKKIDDIKDKAEDIKNKLNL